MMLKHDSKRNNSVLLTVNSKGTLSSYLIKENVTLAKMKKEPKKPEDAQKEKNDKLKNIKPKRNRTRHEVMRSLLHKMLDLNDHIDENG